MTSQRPTSLRMNSPAKINLHLEIRGKRPDGFHEIETLMVPLTLHDTLDVRLVERGISLTCTQRGIPTGPDNLAVRAAALFLEETGLDVGVDIHLQKRIPAGAGLGGGSGNAAAVLVALNRLTHSGLPSSRLEAMAARIGSDVPWFIRAWPARCHGRGELLEDAPAPPAWPLLLVKPPFGVDTPWAYKTWGDCECPRQPARALDGFTLHNDLEPPVFRKFPLLSALKSWLEAQPGIRAAAMSGSGSTLFAVLNQTSLAPSLAQRLRAFAGPTLWTHACQVATPSKNPPPKIF